MIFDSIDSYGLKEKVKPVLLKENIKLKSLSFTLKALEGQGFCTFIPEANQLSQIIETFKLRPLDANTSVDDVFKQLAAGVIRNPESGKKLRRAERVERIKSKGKCWSRLKEKMAHTNEITIYYSRSKKGKHGNGYFDILELLYPESKEIGCLNIY